MGNRVCAEPGCPAITAGQPRCAAHTVALERARGTRQQRGYDAAYDRNTRDPAYLAATHCTTCGVSFTADNPRTAGHVVAIRNGGGSAVQPECRRCNYGWRRTGN